MAITEPNTYDIGDRIKVSQSTVFTDTETSTAFDPENVKGKFIKPDGTETVYEYGVDSELVKAATGSYYFEVNLTAAGKWRYRIWGYQDDGEYRGSDAGYFMVKPADV